MKISLHFFPSLLPGLPAFSLFLLYFVFHIVASYLSKYRYYHILLLLRNIQWIPNAFRINYLYYHTMFLRNFISTYLSSFISSQCPTLHAYYSFLLFFIFIFHTFMLFLLLWKSWKRRDFRAGQTWILISYHFILVLWSSGHFILSESFFLVFEKKLGNYTYLRVMNIKSGFIPEST